MSNENIAIKSEDTQKDRFLTFYIDKEAYGLEILYVKEIVGIQEITKVPEFPEYVKGIINLRGIIIPVIDVRLRFKKEQIIYNDRTCIIVVEVKNIVVGLIVDSVSEVLSIPKNNISETPKLLNSIKTSYLKEIGKVGNEVVLLLDCENFLSDNEIGNFSNVM